MTATGRPTPQQRKGRDAEERAHAFLVAQGLRPVTRNYRLPFGEIDLIMRHRDTLVFVEVRARRSARFGSAAESVDARKRARIVAAAHHYLQRHPEHGARSCRFDVIAIDGGQTQDLQWLPNAFESGI